MVRKIQNKSAIIFVFIICTVLISCTEPEQTYTRTFLQELADNYLDDVVPLEESNQIQHCHYHHR